MENQKELLKQVLKVVKQNQIVNEEIKRLLESSANVQTGRLSTHLTRLENNINELEKQLLGEDYGKSTVPQRL